MGLAGVLLGLAWLIGSLIYAAISSLLVWRLAKTTRGVLAVHGGILVTAFALFALPRLSWLVAR